ncbi:MAG: hydrogenase nickel incorporation protein HypB [Bacteroides sp. SM23_62_1]|nr:MAG: hydrogenase nickel incorporation protein HypB [Bacteroides sp. SM23_62_1]
MCDTCGCGQPGKEVKIMKPGDVNGEEKHHHTYTHSHEHHHQDGDHFHTHEHGHSYDHAHDGITHEHDHMHSHDNNHGHDHSHESHEHSHGRKVEVEQDILGRNNLMAEHNRGYFEAKNILAFDLVSSPGSGKTTLLEKTILELKKEISFYVIEGDQQTMNDANRIHQTGVPVIQINTGEGCHLDADMIYRAVRELEPANDSVLMIENVGNLVCPALFDLGETRRIVIMSVTEGDDKPAKYPYMFRTSDLCIINKTDLLPYVDFDMDKARAYAQQINPQLQFIELSARTGEGMEKWYAWFRTYKKNQPA